MTPGVRARVGAYHLHQALDLPDVAAIRCNCYLSFDYHQKWPRAALHWTGWQESPEYAYVIAQTGCLPERILFVDDNQVNVDSAAATGMVARRTVGITGVREVLREFGIV